MSICGSEIDSEDGRGSPRAMTPARLRLRMIRAQELEEQKQAWFVMHIHYTVNVLACLEKDGLLNMAKLNERFKPVKTFHFLPRLDEIKISNVDDSVHPVHFHARTMAQVTSQLETIQISPHLPMPLITIKPSDTQEPTENQQLQTLLAFYQHVHAMCTQRMKNTMVFVHFNP